MLQLSDFDAIIGIDWTGAQPARGIAVGEVQTGEGIVRRVFPQGRFWSRLEVMDWLAKRIGQGQRLLIGIDCAFGLPWVPHVGYLDGRVPDVTGMFSLWDLVEEASGAAPDAFAGPAVLDPRLEPSFWISGPTPAHWGNGATKRRQTELVAAETGVGHPVSVLKLAAASKQVGKASLAGMRSVRHLRQRVGSALRVWPAEAPEAGKSVVLEIFPTLFREQASGIRKITTRTALEAALSHFGAHISADTPETFDDHTGDALVSAAGLAWLLREKPQAWRPSGMTPERAQREGWIFGVDA